MYRTGAVVTAETLQHCGATHVFGNPGTTELPFVNAVVESDLTYVTCLHEDVAVGAAAGFATRVRQLSRNRADQTPLTVANLHTTPGVAHGLGNLYGAKFARAPVLLTAGCQTARHERREPPLSGDRQTLVETIVKSSARVDTVDDLPDAVAGAARTALRSPSGPTYLEFSLDVQHAMTAAEPTSLGDIGSAPEPNSSRLQEIADILDDESVTFVVGNELGAAGRETIDDAARLAERLHAPVYGQPLFGEMPFPPNHPNWVGMLPYDAAEIRDRLTADTIVFLGCTHAEPLLDYDPPLWDPESQAIWIGAHDQSVPSEASYKAIVTGALDSSLQGLLDALKPALAADGSGIASIREQHRTSMITATAGQQQAELDAKRAAAEAIATVGEEAVIVEEGVTTGFLLRDRGDLQPNRFIGHSSGGLGYGLPAAVGAAIAETDLGNPPRPVIGLVGDGSYQYYPQAIYTAAQYVETPLILVVPVNAGYGILRDRDEIDESAATEPPLTFDEAVSIPQNASSYGVRTTALDDPRETAEALSAAIDTGGIEVIAVDVGRPDVP